MAHPRAGQPAQPSDLVDLSALEAAYYDRTPDPTDPAQQVVFGTSGHRGSSLDTAFNEAHILATTQAICEYRRSQGTTGPLLIGRDTHALSLPTWHTALQVLVANDVTVLVDSRDAYTPTPAVSHAILALNRDGSHGRVDGIVVTPSHNPPRDGGFKYNPPHGGPAGSAATGAIADRANELLRGAWPAYPAPPPTRRATPCRATTSSATTSTTCRACSTSTPSGPPGFGSGPIHSVVRPCTTGARSHSATAWT